MPKNGPNEARSNGAQCHGNILKLGTHFKGQTSHIKGQTSKKKRKRKTQAILIPFAYTAGKTIISHSKGKGEGGRHAKLEMLDSNFPRYLASC